MTDYRFPAPGTDARFPSVGVDMFFPAPGTDARFVGGKDFRFEDPGFVWGLLLDELFAPLLDENSNQIWG
jgi:hypothetical protein